MKKDWWLPVALVLSAGTGFAEFGSVGKLPVSVQVDLELGTVGYLRYVLFDRDGTDPTDTGMEVWYEEMDSPGMVQNQKSVHVLGQLPSNQMPLCLVDFSQSLWLQVFFSEDGTDDWEPCSPRSKVGDFSDVLTHAAFVGEIRLYAGNTEPGENWVTCDGRLMAISGNEPLFEVIGNTYGGDGRTTFGLPDLRGRVPMGVGAGPGLTNREIGQELGSESVVLAIANLPSHDHSLRGTNSAATQTSPSGNILATNGGSAQYLGAAASVTMGSGSIGATGSNSPLSIIQPASVLRFIICTRANPTPSVWDAYFPGQGASKTRNKGNGGFKRVTRLDNHSGLQFTSGGVDYIGLKLLEHESGIGTIWFAIPRNHDLETGPVTPLIVLNPDVMTPV